MTGCGPRLAALIGTVGVLIWGPPQQGTTPRATDTGGWAGSMMQQARASLDNPSFFTGFCIGQVKEHGAGPLLGIGNSMTRTW